MRETIIMAVRTTLLIYAGLLVVMMGCQRRMMYFPSRSTEADAIRFAAQSGLVPWRDGAGRLIGWQPADAPMQDDAMLLFHGNAGFAAHRGYFVHGFAPYIAVYLLEYPGYGAREGKPTEATLVSAGEAALRQLREERSGRIFLGGESLGTGVACHLAGAHPQMVSGLFLSTPFSSLVDVARSHYPFFPIRWLMRDRYENEAHLTAYQGPVAILLAGQDEVVPSRFGQQLYDTYDGPKQIWIQADRSHNTLDYAPGRAFWREAARFLQGP